MEKNTEKILESLEPLFKDAEENDLYFFNRNQSLYFTAEELRKFQEKGLFILGRDKWELVDPINKIEALKKEKKYLDGEIKILLEKIKG